MAMPLQVPMNYVEPPTVPEGMTLTDYRCRQQRPPTRRRRARRGVLAFLRRFV
jgi:hypothetical protein